MEGRGRGHRVAPPGRAEEPAHRTALRLVEPGGELPERAHAAIPGQARRDHDRQVAPQSVALPAPFAKILNLPEKVVKTAQLPRRHRRLARLHRRVPIAQRLAGAGFKLVHVDLLGLAVLAPARRAAVHPRITARQAQHPPVRRPVADPRKPRRVHERLRQQHRKTVHRAHVPRQPAQTQTQHPRGQVADLPLAHQQRETTVVRDQLQPPELPLSRPAEPLVPNAHLERPRRPAHQRQPASATHRHMTQRLPEQTLERQIVKLPHQRIPTPPLRRTAHRANRHIAQLEPAPGNHRYPHGSLYTTTTSE